MYQFLPLRFMMYGTKDDHGFVVFIIAFPHSKVWFFHSKCWLYLAWVFHLNGSVYYGFEIRSRICSFFWRWLYHNFLL